MIAGAGSRGTYSGIIRCLKERDPSGQGVLVDPVGSTMGGGARGRLVVIFPNRGDRYFSKGLYEGR